MKYQKGHFGEPVSVVGGITTSWIRNSKNKTICVIDSAYFEKNAAKNIANRIAACINALNGLNPEALQVLIEAATECANNWCYRCGIDCEQATEFTREECVVKNLKAALDALKGDKNEQTF